MIENYYTSSGHGHEYDRYLQYGKRDGRRSVVVMLCEREDPGALTDGWEAATVVLYADLLTELRNHIERDHRYRTQHPEQVWFLDQMHRRYAKGQTVNNQALVDFIEVLCRTGEANHFGMRPNAAASIRFADRLRKAALEQFNDSRELVARVKRELRAYGEHSLIPRINTRLGDQRLHKVNRRVPGHLRVDDQLPRRGERGGQVPGRRADQVRPVRLARE